MKGVLKESHAARGGMFRILVGIALLGVGHLKCMVGACGRRGVACLLGLYNFCGRCCTRVVRTIGLKLNHADPEIASALSALPAQRELRGLRGRLASLLGQLCVQRAAFPRIAHGLIVRAVVLVEEVGDRCSGLVQGRSTLATISFAAGGRLHPGRGEWGPPTRQ
jgi:hypothetical protein|eukprot:COSAG06_NODE_18998_length_858_cov_1.162055_2_plen_165_part_00